MASAIDVTKPVSGSPTTLSVRTNFSAAKSEIEALQNDKAPLASPVLTGAASAVDLSVSGTLNAAGVLQINGFPVSATAAELNTLSGVTASVLEINHLVGVTSAIQTQLDAKADSGGLVTLTGTETLTNKTLTQPQLTGALEGQVAIGTNCDLATGSYFTKTITGATTFTVSNVPTTGKVIWFAMDIINGGSDTITWWAGIKWAYGIAPTLVASGRDLLMFGSYDGGSTWIGQHSVADAQ